MNEAQIYVQASADLEHDEPHAETAALSLRSSSLAAWLRWGGAAAMVLSGLIYLLQGVDDPHTVTRDWVYIGMMVLLGGAGISSAVFFKDNRGARLCFALACALLPLQFSQVAGVFSEHISGAHSNASWWLPAAATLLLCLPISYAAFSVLTRPAARLLTLLFFVANCVLLFPGRDFYSSGALLIYLGGGALVLERLWFQQQAHFATPEGYGVRAILLLPLAIALGRSGFAISEFGGFCAVVAMVGYAIARCALVLPAQGLRETLVTSGTLFTSIAWLAFATLELPVQNTGWHTAAAFAPLTLLFLDTARVSIHGSGWRRMAALTAAITAYGVFVAQVEVLSGLVILSLGLALATWGVSRQEREPALFGVVISFAGTLVLIAEALSGISVNVWVLLSLVGLTALLGASALERYGRNSLVWLNENWQTVRQWD